MVRRAGLQNAWIHGSAVCVVYNLSSLKKIGTHVVSMFVSGWRRQLYSRRCCIPLVSRPAHTSFLSTQVKILAQRENRCCYGPDPNLVLNCELPRVPRQPWARGLPAPCIGADKGWAAQGHVCKRSSMNKSSTWQVTRTMKRPLSFLSSTAISQPVLLESPIMANQGEAHVRKPCTDD